ncbi:helix-turn-helix domain-containing protein [Chryseobacterium nematophagum]|uniref:Helix-turn-helix domain-containing protein n=1 Tax=Chryseobacterium nematophagum TaxID=2305228 RepID=A0A3M7TD57_9FLAO|nr:helix-turn-helix domain-containing protein [Chryseobacterium nematophagum]RNA61513.1 helix-turn-helix domain-containing protein [Chryseobacterium nematophagum]
MLKKAFLLLLVLCQNLYFSQSIKGFRIPDSLNNKSFEQLEKAYKNIFPVDKAKAEIYANTILLNGKADKNETKMADGYLMLYKVNNTSKEFYLDSMMIMSKKMQNNDYVANSYKYKGNYYYLKGEYSNALNNYLMAREYVKSNNETYYILNYNIGLLKLELKEYKQAISLFLDYEQYLTRNNIINIDYLSCIYTIAYAYSFTNELKLSDHYIELGLKTNFKIKDKENEYGLLLVSGMNHYKRKEYKSALKDLKKANKIIRDNSYNSQNLAINEYYIGRIFYDTNDKKFINTFEKTDSIIIQTKNVTSELREIYPILIDYYKKMGNKEKQLLYIEHLLSVDSILNKNNHFLSTEIIKKYDTPILLKEKETLIADLNFKNYTLFWLLGIGSIFLLGLSFLYIENRKKIKLYKNKASLLIQLPISINSNENLKPIVKEKIETSQEKPKTSLSDHKLHQLSKQLKEFENKTRFLNNTINLDTLSKEFNTNRAYLSKSVNELKGKSFPQYLNELRIQYIIEELKKNKNLQKLTIAAIADEAGYNNVESFTNAFKKSTGTLPSYFIRALQENSN